MPCSNCLRDLPDLEDFKDIVINVNQCEKSCELHKCYLCEKFKEPFVWIENIPHDGVKFFICRECWGPKWK